MEKHQVQTKIMVKINIKKFPTGLFIIIYSISTNKKYGKN